MSRNACPSDQEGVPCRTRHWANRQGGELHHGSNATCPRSGTNSPRPNGWGESLTIEQAMAGGVGVPGFEPGTSSLSATRSNQLSYTPETSHTSARRHTVETLRWQRRRCILGTVRWVSNRVHCHFAVPSSKRGRVLHLGAKLRRPEARILAVTLPGARTINSSVC